MTSVGPRPTEDELLDRFRQLRARLVPKSSSRLMRALDVLLRPLGNRRFLSHYWTTIGRTIYTPLAVDDPYAHPGTLEHELVHVAQWDRHGLAFAISYLALPLPIGLAWFRFRWEREAYLVQLRDAPDVPAEIDRIVEALWRDYAYPWPRAWMRAWFRAHNPSESQSKSRGVA